MEIVEWNVIKFIKENKPVNYESLKLSPKEFTETIEYLIQKGILCDVVWGQNNFSLNSAMLNSGADNLYLKYLGDRTKELKRLFSLEYKVLNEKEENIKQAEEELRELELKRKIIMNVVVGSDESSEYFDNSYSDLNKRIDSTKEKLDTFKNDYIFLKRRVELLEKASESVL